jgi:hypothetical protein
LLAPFDFYLILIAQNSSQSRDHPDANVIAAANFRKRFLAMIAAAEAHCETSTFCKAFEPQLARKAFKPAARQYQEDGWQT